MHLRLQRGKETLQNGGWEGRGAKAFYAEMDSVVIPGARRLHEVLGQAAEVTLKIIKTMRQAEEEAARVFRGSSAGLEAANGALASGGSSASVVSTQAPTIGPGLPPRPSPPPAPTSGDGSGQYNVESAAVMDYSNRELFYKVADTADTLGLDNAARNMRHYLNNSGGELHVSPEQMLNDLPGFREKAERTFQHQVVGVVNERIANEYAGQPMQFQVSTNWDGYYAGKSQSPDWFYATGGYSYAYGAEVNVTPGPGGQPHVELNYQMHVFDRYNWDENKKVNIGPWEINDVQLGRLHTVGLAREYEIWGTSTVQTHSYDYTPQSSDTGAAWKPGEPADQRRDDTRRDPDGTRRWGRGEGR